MASKDFTFASFGWRFLFALLLVFLTYNPSGYSYVHWLRASLSDFTPILAIAGVVLLIGWAMYLRATWASLGPFGAVLAVAFFGVIVWLMVDIGMVQTGSLQAIAWLAEFILAGVLAAGMSWSHIRRKISGQYDTDEIEG